MTLEAVAREELENFLKDSKCSVMEGFHEMSPTEQMERLQESQMHVALVSYQPLKAFAFNRANVHFLGFMLWFI